MSLSFRPKAGAYLAMAVIAGASLPALGFVSCVKAKAVVARPPQAVKVATTERRDFVITSEYAARISPALEVNVTPKVGGKVLDLRVDVGMRVAKGDVLLELDASDYDAQYRQAKATLGTAKASLARTSDSGQEQQVLQAQAAVDQAAVAYDDAKSLFDKTARLFDSGAVSKQQLDDVEARYKSAGIQLDAARRSLAIVKDKAGSQANEIASGQVDAAAAQADLARSQLDATVIRSPISGRVSYRGVETGEMIGSSTLAFVVIDDSSVVAEAELSERQVGSVRKGMPLEVKIPALANSSSALADSSSGGSAGSFAGKVDSVSPAADPRSLLYAVKVRVPNAAGRIKGGMIARLRVPLETRPRAVIAPEQAVFSENGGDYAFVVLADANGGFKAAKRLVRLGESDGVSVEILDGLGPGDRLVVEGKEFIADGDAIRVVD
jgi:RND family efflux transporter MFP subunit